MTLDISDTLAANSAQLNAADLCGSTITVRITGASRQTDDKQPLILDLSDGHKPWKPCKAMRRMMSTVWDTTDAGVWIGRWVELYNEPTVIYGSDDPGGIRVCGMSHIAGNMSVTVPDNVRGPDGKKKPRAVYKLRKIVPPAETKPTTQAPTDPLREAIGVALKSGAWTKDQVLALLRGGKAADVPEAERANVMDALKAGPADPTVAAFLAEYVPAGGA